MDQEQIERNHSAAMDSVNLINAGQPSGVSDDDWIEMLANNHAHLVHVRANYEWDGMDMTAIDACIEASQ